MINIFLAAVESDVDLDADADVVFKDPAQYISTLFTNSLKKRDLQIFEIKFKMQFVLIYRDTVILLL